MVLLYVDAVFSARISVKGEVTARISDVLITKVLLGTLGCVPAYDKNFTMTAGKFKLRLGSFSPESFKLFIQFYTKYDKSFDHVRKEMVVANVKQNFTLLGNLFFT